MKFDINSVINKFNTMFNSWRAGIGCNWNLRTHRQLYDPKKGTKGYMWVQHWFLLGLIFPRLRPKGPEEMYNVDDPRKPPVTEKHVHRFRCGAWFDYVSFNNGKFGGHPVGLRWRQHKVAETGWQDHWEASITPRRLVGGDNTDENMLSKTGPPRPPLGGGVKK